MHGPYEVPGVMFGKPSHHAAGGDNTVTHLLKTIQNLRHGERGMHKGRYIKNVPAKRECCIPQSSPGHHEIQADLIPSQLGGEPDEKNDPMR